MLKQISCLPLALLFAGSAFATFEIKDPAAEIMEEQNKTVSDALAEKTCVQFLRPLGVRNTRHVLPSR